MKKGKVTTNHEKLLTKSKIKLLNVKIKNLDMLIFLLIDGIPGSSSEI
ncbi:MAG TPA: hypothetical protein VGF30_03590 [Bacteroidia bacterium]